MPFLISVVIPTHNPREDYLARVIEALRAQTMSKDLWELVIVDNGSREALEVASGQMPVVSKKPNAVDLSWHLKARIVREERLGLTFARLRGFAEAKGDLIVMVDDDNLLAPEYLANAVEIASKHPDIGAFGGRCLPEFETEPEPWMREFLPLLALRDHGNEEIVSGDVRSPDGSRRAYPDRAAPIGAGMVLRRDAAAAYAERMTQEARQQSRQESVGSSQPNGCKYEETAEGLDEKTKRRKDQRSDDRGQPERSVDSVRRSRGQMSEGGSAYAQIGSGVTRTVLTDRRGDSLASAGDNDLVFTILRDGWKVGYFPNLVATHLIPKSRLTLDYLARANHGVQRSWVEVLRRHGACPWPTIGESSLALRKWKAWFANRAWSAAGKIRWNGCCGNFEGRVSS